MLHLIRIVPINYILADFLFSVTTETNTNLAILVYGSDLPAYS